MLEPPLAGQLRRALGLRELARLVHLRAAEDTPVARGECLADGRGRAEDVDDDPDRSGRLLTRGEGDVHAHCGGYASPDDDDRDPVLLPASGPRDRSLLLRVRTADLRRLRELRTGRHPLPDHASVRRAGPATRIKPRPVLRAPGVALGTNQAPVTYVLIAVNVLIYLVAASQASSLFSPGPSMFQPGLSTTTPCFMARWSHTATGGVS